MGEVNNNTIAQFQVVYMSYLGLNHNKAFKYQDERNMDLKLDKRKMIPIKIVLKKYNNRVLAILMFYENRDKMIFKVLGSIIY